jgi:hypothetical protein
VAPLRRHLAVLLAVCVTGLVFAAWAPAAGDRHVTGPPRAERFQTVDGMRIPVATGGPECKAGKGAHRHGHRTTAGPADARAY